jgi:hypothetical protein
MATFLAGLAGQLRTGWSRAAADRWLTEARELGAEVARADRTLARAEQSARLNPLGGRARDVQPRLRTALTGLEHCQITMRSLCRALLDRAYFVPDGQEGDAYGEDVRLALAGVLDAAAAAIAAVAPVAAVPAAGTAATTPTDEARAAVEARVAELHRRRDTLAGLLLVDPHTDQGAWQQHGALLAAVDRLRVEVDAAVRPPTGSWRPPPVSERQRRAVRRVIDARAERQRGRPPRRSRRRPPDTG